MTVIHRKLTYGTLTCGFLQWRIHQGEAGRMFEDMLKKLHTYHERNGMNIFTKQKHGHKQIKKLNMFLVPKLW